MMDKMELANLVKATVECIECAMDNMNQVQYGLEEVLDKVKSIEVGLESFISVGDNNELECDECGLRVGDYN